MKKQESKASGDALLKDLQEQLKEQREKRMGDLRSSRNDHYEKLDQAWDTAVATYKKAEMSYIEKYNNYKKNGKDVEELENLSISLEKSKLRLESVGQPKDAFTLEGKKLGYQIELEHALRSIEAIEKLKDAYTDSIDLTEVEKQLRLASRNKKRYQKFLEKPDTEALNKLKDKRIKSIESKALTAIARAERKKKDAQLAEKDKEDKIRRGIILVEKKVEIPNWLFTIIVVFSLVCILSIVGVSYTGISAWYAVFPLITLPLSVVFIGHKYLLPS